MSVRHLSRFQALSNADDTDTDNDAQEAHGGDDARTNTKSDAAAAASASAASSHQRHSQVRQRNAPSMHPDRGGGANSAASSHANNNNSSSTSSSGSKSKPSASYARRSSSRSPPRSTVPIAANLPPAPPRHSAFVVACHWFLFALWKLLQTLICLSTFFLGGFLCGGCCLPCRRKPAVPVKQPHRRRRRRNASDGSPGTDFEEWTEDDDDDFEYEKPEPASRVASRANSRRGSSAGLMGVSPFDSASDAEDLMQDDSAKSRRCSRCRRHGLARLGRTLALVFLALLAVYIMLFVRVVPSRLGGGSGSGTDSSFEFEFGLPNGYSSIGVPIPETLHSSLHALLGQGTRPGLKARADGLRAHFPIVFVPGIVSTALEVWEGETCAKHHFRQRLWGSALMLRSILLDSRCWLRHLSLDGWTGLDPPGIKLRPASGLEASDYLVGGFWIWAKLIENFADVGYDANSMYMAPYDWRLSFKHLQLRDYYFTKLKATIEIAKMSNQNRKVVMIAHSMGGSVVTYFLQWVESPIGGNGGPTWVSDHVESWVNIGVPFLGVPKVFSAIFSGEMRDTAELAPFLDYWRQRVVFSQADVLNIMRTYRSLPGMFPKGGNIVWGDSVSAPDDEVEQEDTQPAWHPTRDYPGGRNEPFMTSQASAAHKGESREDPDRVEETKKREPVNVAADAGGEGSAGADENDPSSPPARSSKSPVISPRSSYLGQFLSFSHSVPWPFPNITKVVEDLLEDQRRARARHNRTSTTGKDKDKDSGGKRARGTREARELREGVSSSIDSSADAESLLDSAVDAATASSSERNVTVTSLNLEDAIHLLKLIAWPDIDFNEQLYSQGYGSKLSMEEVNALQGPNVNYTNTDDSADGNSTDANSANATERATRAPLLTTTLKTKLSQYPLELLDLTSPSVKNDQRRWANPLETALPLAPHMKIYCFYGVGRNTERGYVYAKAAEIPDWPSVTDLLPSSEGYSEHLTGQEKRGRPRPHRRAKGAGSDSATQPESDSGDAVPNVDESEHGNEPKSTAEPHHIGARAPTIPLFQLNTSFHHAAAHIGSGVKLTDGDGTVPLVSLGYMCIDGWRSKRWNPSGLPVITREYRDLNESLPMLRSATSVDHVDIMGNSDMIADLIYIASIRKKHKQGKDKSEGESAEPATLRAGSKASASDGGSSDSSSDSADSAPLDSPTHGALTWTEVSERIYSRIRPISQRVHARWEDRTGHSLVEADKPPPLSPLAADMDQARQAALREAAAVAEAAANKDGAKADDRKRNDAAPDSTAEPTRLKAKLRFEWTVEDEANLHRLLALKLAADAAASVSGSASTSVSPLPHLTDGTPTPAESDLSHRASDELLEQQLAAAAEERASRLEHLQRNEQRDRELDEHRQEAIRAESKEKEQ